MELVKIFLTLCVLLGLIITITKASDEDCDCGWRNYRSRIVGGLDAGTNEFPMIAGIVFAPSKIVFCGAAIITQKHVISKAGCYNNYKKDSSDLLITVGEYNIHQIDETNTTQFYAVKKTIIHPKYDASSLDYNIAISESVEDFKFSIFVGPVCLPFNYLNLNMDVPYVTALGWGNRLLHRKRASKLQKIDTCLVSPDECVEEYKTVSKDHVICTARGRSGICQHDDGGPVMFRSTKSNRQMLLGVITEGGCGKKPSISMRVASFLDFIQSSTPGYKYCIKD